MKGIHRIILEITIISILVVFINDCFSQQSRTAASEYDLQQKPTSLKKTEPKMLVGIGAAGWKFDLLEKVPARSIYSTYWGAGYKPRAGFFPVIGYDPHSKKLIPLKTSLEFGISKKPIPGEELAFFFAGLSDSVSYSHNDLEDRVRKLENKVAQIEKECCD